MKITKLKVLSALLLTICLLNPNGAFADFREHFDLAQNYLSQYQYSGAISEFKNALRINYMDRSARIGLVNAYLARGTQYANKDRAWDKAADDYRSALFYLRYYPEEQDVRNSAQAIDQIVSNLDKCLSQINYDRSPQNRFNTAKKLRAEGNFSAAVYEFSHSLGDKSLQKSSFEQIGEIMAILGNKQKAAEYYKKAVSVSSSDLNLRLTYAKSLDDIDKSDEALKEYSYVLSKATSDDKDILYVLERTFNKKLTAEPDNANYYVNMGAVLQKENRLDEALTYYKKAETLDPSNINTRINVGTLYQQKEDYRTAIKAYESVLILYPDNVNANLYRAQCYEKLGDDKIAQEGYKKVMAVDPENPVIKKQMIENVKKSSTPQQFVDYLKANYPQDAQAGMIYDYAVELHKASKTEDAIYAYKTAMEIYGNDASPELYINLALAQAQGGYLDEAAATLNTAQAKYPNEKSIKDRIAEIKSMKSDKQINTAADLFNNKKYDEAIKAYLAVVPATVDSMLGVATSYQQSGNIDKAIEYYKKALDLKPLDSDIAYYIAALYGEKEDYANAKIYLGKSIAFNKNNQQAVEYLKSINENEKSNLLNDAINKYEANDYNESLQEFNKILATDKDNDYALYYRGMIYDAQKKHNEAIADLKRAYALNKDFTICNYTIAANYDELKNYKEAYKYYELYASSDVPDDEYKKYAASRAKELKDYVNKTAASK